jgi:hypothetical protein
MKINRRRFLKSTLLAGTALGIESFNIPCYGFGRVHLYRDAPEDQKIEGLDERRIRILYYASLAPSGHNTQPWIVKVINENEWIIGIDATRHLSATDTDNRIMLLSLGAFVENLCVAAGALGLNADAEVIARDLKDTNILKIHLKEGKQTGYPLKRIQKRMTAKNGFLQKEISRSDVTAFSKLLDGNLFYFPRETSHATCIQEGAIENFKLQAGRKEAQQELVRWLRLKDRDIEKYRDGLTVAGMEIRGIKGWFVKHFVQPENFLKDSFKEQSIAHTAKLAGEGGGWFVITSDGHSVLDIISSGRKFEKMSLTARERGIAVHPMTQYLEEKQGVSQIDENHEKTIIPQLILRVGYLEKYPDPVSPRRPVNWFVRPG